MKTFFALPDRLLCALTRTILTLLSWYDMWTLEVGARSWRPQADPKQWISQEQTITDVSEPSYKKQAIASKLPRAQPTWSLFIMFNACVLMYV